MLSPGSGPACLVPKQPQQPILHLTAKGFGRNLVIDGMRPFVPAGTMNPAINGRAVALPFLFVKTQGDIALFDQLKPKNGVATRGERNRVTGRSSCGCLVMAAEM